MHLYEKQKFFVEIDFFFFVIFAVNMDIQTNKKQKFVKQKK